MIGSHGSARRAGRAWLIFALAASGLHAVTMGGAGSAPACHISSHQKPKVAAEAADGLIPAAGAATHATGHPASLTPTSYVPHVTPPTILTPSPASASRPVVTTAAEQLPTATQTVETFNTDHPHGIATPPLHHFGSAMPHPATMHPPKPCPVVPATPPAALEVTAAPEPSTACIALALSAAFAWRRRVTRKIG